MGEGDRSLDLFLSCSLFEFAYSDIRNFCSPAYLIIVVSILSYPTVYYDFLFR